MPVTCQERVDSRRLIASRDGLQSSLELTYVVTGTANETVAKNLVQSASPAVYGTGSPLLWRQTISLAPVAMDEARPNACVWEALVRYDTNPPEPLSANDSLEFDTTGGVQRITQALAVQGTYPPGSPDYGGAIGVTETSIEGVDVVVPIMRISETHFYPEISHALVQAIFACTGRINAYPFKGFGIGEVKFEGATGRQEDNRQNTPWSLTYRFSCQPTRTNFQVGGINIAHKYGWDHMWIRYVSTEVTDPLTGSPITIPLPYQVNVVQVYPVADFAVLGIGV